MVSSFASAADGVDVSFTVQSLRIQDEVQSRLSGKTSWALMTEDIIDGKRLVAAGRTGDPLIPGSLVKLFVTGAVLERDRKEPFDLFTVILSSGTVKQGKLQGGVVIRGAGNPLLSTNDLLSGVEKLKAEGITEIDGDVLVDDSLFETRDWKSRLEGPAYARPSALGLDLHTVSITAEPASRKAVVDPPNDEVRVSFNPEGTAGIRRIDDLTYEVTGADQEANVTRKRFALDDPAMYAGGVFRTLLQQAGIKVAGMVKRETAPSPQPAPARGERDRRFIEVARVGGRDIASLVQDTNKQSLNTAAENLLLLLGAKAYGAPGTKHKGIKAVNGFLQDLEVPTEGLILDDGSGVSDADRVSAEQIVTFLRGVSRRPWFNEFYESLAKPGIDGRLADFGYTSDRIRAKSGQVRDAFCIAGYVDRQTGRRSAFAFLVNGAEANTPAAHSAAVAVLKGLAE